MVPGMRIHDAHEVQVAAGCERCFEILLDVEGYPAWWPGATETQVLRPGPEPEVRLVFDPHLPGAGVIDLELRFETEPPVALRPRLLGGRLSRLEGPGWTLREQDGGGCLVRYEVEAEMDTGLPGFLEKRFAGQAARFLVTEPVEALKRRAEG